MSVVTTQLFDFRNVLLNPPTGIGKMDALVNVTPSLKLSEYKKYYIRPLSAELSSRIPNVFQSTNPLFNNRRIYIKRNIADPFVFIDLPVGIYTPQQLGQAIVSAVQAWFTNPADPSLVISTNSVIDVVNISIIGGKLASGGTQFCLDIQTNSDMYKTLGFSFGSAIFTSNSTFTSNRTPQVDTQTTTVDIICDLCNTRCLNGKLSRILFSIPLVLSNNGTLTTFLYPPAGTDSLPLIPYTGQKTISNYTLQFRTGDDKIFYFMNGNVSIQFAISEIVGDSSD